MVEPESNSKGLYSHSRMCFVAPHSLHFKLLSKPNYLQHLEMMSEYSLCPPLLISRVSLVYAASLIWLDNHTLVSYKILGDVRSLLFYVQMEEDTSQGLLSGSSGCRSHSLRRQQRLYVWYCKIGVDKLGWCELFIRSAERLLLYHSSSAPIPAT